MPVFVKRSHFWIASSRRAVLANSGVRSPPPSRPLHSNSCAGNHRPREIGHGLALLFRSCHFDEALKKNSSTSQCSRFSSASGADSLTVQEYNFLADRALLELQDMLEVALEDSGDDDVDVDYSVWFCTPHCNPVVRALKLPFHSKAF